MVVSPWKWSVVELYFDLMLSRFFELARVWVYVINITFTIYQLFLADHSLYKNIRTI